MITTNKVVTIHYTLRNDAGNSFGIEGTYSPGHPDQQWWFDYGLRIRAVYSYAGDDYVRWTGKVGTIDPDWLKLFEASDEA